MKRLIIAAAMLLAAAGAEAQNARQNEYQSYVEVNGVAEREIDPNRIYLAITINEQNSKGKITVEEQERKMMEVLRGLGIDVKTQLRVSDITSSTIKRTRAVTVKNYQLLLTETSLVSEVYASLQQAGITSIAIEKVSHSDLETFRAEVRNEAMRNARTTAAELAQAVGQTIGKAFYINYYNNFVQPVLYRMAKANVMMTNADGVEESFDSDQPEFRKIKLTATVSAKFVLE